MTKPRQKEHAASIYTLGIHTFGIGQRNERLDVPAKARDMKLHIYWTSLRDGRDLILQFEKHDLEEFCTYNVDEEFGVVDGAGAVDGRVG
jgi:hypothetical protein